MRFVMVVGLSFFVSVVSAYAVSSALQPPETEQNRLERELARSSKKWCPPRGDQRTANDYLAKLTKAGSGSSNSASQRRHFST